MTQPTAIITGVTHGIGRVTCIEMVKSGYDVIALCRDVSAGLRLQEQIVSSLPDARVRIVHCDLASLASVRQGVQTLRRTAGELQVLINNAGTVSARRRTSADGFELTFAINQLGPFLLTRLLLDRMHDGARIVNVASRAHYGAKLDLDTVTHSRGFYNGIAHYAQSKLANVMFTFALARRLAPEQATVNCLHPGVVRTHLLPAWLRWLKRLVTPGMLDVEAGAKTTLYLARSDEVAGRTGCYFGENQCEQKAATVAYDVDAQERLWRACDRWVDL